MNPYQPGEDNQDPYEVGYKAGAASRDAEVVSLTNQRDYEYVRAENAEQERDQLRAQINDMRVGMEEIVELSNCMWSCQKATELLASTPEQSLAEYRNKLIEHEELETLSQFVKELQQ